MYFVMEKAWFVTATPQGTDSRRQELGQGDARSLALRDKENLWAWPSLPALPAAAPEVQLLAQGQEAGLNATAGRAGQRADSVAALIPIHTALPLL